MSRCHNDYGESMVDHEAGQALDAILARFRDDARSNREVGDLFERLIASYLLADPKFDFDQVWLWGEWPLRWGADTGIDLVAQERSTGDYWAIQCKFFLPEHSLQKADIDSFFTASGKRFATTGREASFTARLIVTTTEKISSHAEDSFADQGISTTRLTIRDLRESPVDWSRVVVSATPKVPLLKKKAPREDQIEAINNVLTGLKAASRGKAIMACGTGKTFTSLKIAEQIVPASGRVLFLAPSIQLVAQSLREWSSESEQPLHAFAVCSDSKVGKDDEDFRTHDLAYPATTDAQKLALHAERVSTDRRTVVFSTYQSIDVITQAQKLGLGDFDLIICDEAHRTTGIDDGSGHVSEFVKVHEDRFVRARKRLYMTATPRIFAEAAQSKARLADVQLYSMDDESKYGKELHRIGFGEAVQRGLLTDYKVLIVAVDQDKIAGLVNNVNAAFKVDERKAIDVGFAVKVIGSWKGLSKRGLFVVGKEGEPEPLSEDTAPMKRAVAFSRSIKASREITDTFTKVTEIYERSREEGGDSEMIRCELDHVDGGMNALVRLKALSWLKEPLGEGVCRVLSNARCLSEGIDVPTLDGVVFFDTRDSMVDIVQSVGRVMRRADNKNYGYIILPVGIPWSKVNDYNDYVSSDKQFKAIWKVLKALRAHDERLVDEAVFRNRVMVATDPTGSGDDSDRNKGEQFPLEFPALPIANLSEAVYSAIPKKLGDREYWSTWAGDIAKRADAIIARIEKLLKADAEVAQHFAVFLKGLQDTLNPGVSDHEAIEMLAQHILTSPVFQALFSDEGFPQHNVVGRALEAMVQKLDRASIDSETADLAQFYDNVRERVALAKSDKSKQEIVRALYDTFFKTAFKDVATRLGVVYTPVPVVDFILQSANAVLLKHFKKSLASEGVHILDPFAGTGTFPVRLLQSGLIPTADLPRKYRDELHVNEVMLLAYYIANINIETAFHAATELHESFAGMVLTDTFQISEEGDLLDKVVLPENNERIERQQQAPIQVIVGNPPYSVAQGNAKYPTLDQDIANTYARGITAQNQNSLYDSYIRAFRWASNRIGEQGIVCYVTNGGWIDGNAMSGLRRCFSEECSDIYVFNLRGNQRTKGEESRREGGKIFGGGSRAPVAITILVKHPDHHGPARIHYRDIGDYLSEQEKLAIIEEAGDIHGVPWERLQPNEHHDWINLRSEDFATLMPIAGEGGIFETYQNGVQTNRDPWVYDFSREALAKRMRGMVEFYNGEVGRVRARLDRAGADQSALLEQAKALVSPDETKIKWTSSLLPRLIRGEEAEFDPSKLVSSTYRPYARQWLYYDPMFNHRYKARLWPTPGHRNLVIDLKVGSFGDGFFARMDDVIVGLPPAGGNQCLPLYQYVKSDESKSGALFEGSEAGDYVRRDGITDAALARFQRQYPAITITKEDIFYFVYGVLHSPGYLQKYRNDLKRELPRIPFAPDFDGFSSAGRALAAIHLGYETAEPYPVVEESSRLVMEDRDFKVKKMRFGKAPGGGKDKTVIHYNEVITLRGIPLEAYRYVVNGTPAIEWVMDQYEVSRDKDSGIAKDPNDWSSDPRYVVDLLKRVITVSMETMRIVDALPSEIQ